MRPSAAECKANRPGEGVHLGSTRRLSERGREPPRKAAASQERHLESRVSSRESRDEGTGSFELDLDANHACACPRK